MDKRILEIGLSSGLVLVLIAMIVIVQLVVPDGIRQAGFAVMVMIFIITMGIAGVKLLDVK